MTKLVLTILLLLAIYMIVVGVVSLVTSKSLHESNKIVCGFLFPTDKKSQDKNIKINADETFMLRFDEIVCRNSDLKTHIYNKREIRLENGIYGIEIEFIGSSRLAKTCIEELKQLILEHFWVQGFSVYVVGELIDFNKDNEYRIKIFYAVGERIRLLREYEERKKKIKDINERKRAEKKMQLERPIEKVSLGKNKNEAMQQR